MISGNFQAKVKGVENLHGVSPKFHSVESVEFVLKIPIVYSEFRRHSEALTSKFAFLSIFHSNLSKSEENLERDYNLILNY